MKKMNRRGFALPAAIGGLVIVGVLVTAGFYMAQQELRIGVASKNATLAVNLAQTGANEVLVTETTAMAGIGIWSDTTFRGTATAGTWSVEVTRVGTRLFFLDATGEVTEGGAMWSGATRRVGLVTRMTAAELEPPAALTTQGSLTVGGSSIVEGHDSIPSGWDSVCDTASMEDKPGILIDDTTNIKTSGNKYEVAGDPEVEQDATINIDNLLTFGDMTWDDLTGLADKEYPTTTTVTGTAPDSLLVGRSYVCNEIQSNWGDPLNWNAVCGNYFPIIYAGQTLKINSRGVGQGILLVEGDLEVQGGFTFYGPVIVKGELKTAGTGGHFTGGVIAANVNLDTSTVLGNALVSFSTCAVERAILNNSALTRVRPLAMRSWVDLSSVTSY